MSIELTTPAVITADRELLTPSAEIRIEWYRRMSLIRAFERAVFNLNRMGLIPGTAHLYIGMEAIAVGACSAMAETDFLTSTHRGHGHCIARSLDPGRMMAEILGRADGYCGGKGGSMHITDVSRGMLGADGIVGGGIPIAVGAAYGLRLKNSRSIVICFFGDGACNQGSFHEAINMAAVLRLPVIFICENNLWALSARFDQMTAGTSVANRAVAYGIPGERVDGNDVEAVFETVSRSAQRARNGLGPCLVECVSYRWEAHSVFTRQEIRPKEEIEEWKRKDPIANFRARLLELKIARLENLQEIDSQVEAEVTRAVTFAKNSPTPDPHTAFQNVYIESGR
jgi:TPP-dependent pyruvate/acetoin dehydrogenase alpha subunit